MTRSGRVPALAQKPLIIDARQVKSFVGQQLRRRQGLMDSGQPRRRNVHARCQDAQTSSILNGATGKRLCRLKFTRSNRCRSCRIVEDRLEAAIERPESADERRLVRLGPAQVDVDTRELPVWHELRERS